MFNFKKLKIIFCLFFIFAILVLPIGNVFAEDAVDPISLLLLSSPITWPTAVSIEVGKIFGFDTRVLDLLNPVKYIATAIMSAVGSLITAGANLIIVIGGSILTSAVESPTTWASPTDFNLNPVVAEGWGIVRNVANAALIIGLVIIAINIILGREENKAKKTLINFIIIAILINFTPVICGLIIDGSNILTKSFVTGGINSRLIDPMANNFSTAISNLIALGDPVNIFMISFIYLLFALVSFFIYVLYAVLFIGRTVILWILVIVSPVAFATKVFPQSKYIKKIFPSVLYWDDWWENFIQWCVIGIPAGMSIYLANKLIPGITISLDMTNFTSIMKSLISSIANCLVPFIFLIAGFFISISAGGEIGSTVKGIATGAWAISGKKVTDRLAGGIKEGAERSLTIGKEGLAGTVGAVFAGKTPSSPLSFENREEGRRALDKSLSFGAPNAKDDKEAAQDYLKKHPGAYDFKTREGLKRTEINKDVGEYIDSAKTPDELKAVIRDIETLGSQKSKDMAAIKLAGKTDILKDGYSNFVNNTNNKINITNKIEGMSAKTAQKDISAKALGHYDIFKNFNVKQIDYIAENGSEKQRQAMKDMVWGSGNVEFKKKMSDLVLKSQNKTPGKTFSQKEMDEAKAEYDKNVENIQALINKKIV